MKILIVSILATAITTSGAFAGDVVINKDYKQPVSPTPCFRDQELQLDVFGDYFDFPHADDQLKHGRDPGIAGGGGGVGVNYFFMRYIGVGVDGSINSNRGGVADYTGKLIFRYPIEIRGFCLAPYIFGGGGGQSDFRDDNAFNDDFARDRFQGGRFIRGVGRRTESEYMTGFGVEWRITPRIGVFTEGRYTWTGGRNNDGDNAQARLGLRVAF